MQTIRLGTRGSKLALWQAGHVADTIKRQVPHLNIEIKTIQTKGDKILDVALSKIGDKGLFTKEIDMALLCGEIDIAVHSMKDLPSVMEEGLIISGVLIRENPYDVLISHKKYTISSLPLQAVIGTSSLRRIAQLKSARPDLVIVDMRGNVETRIRKMQEQDLDGIILAYAGIKRLGHEDMISDIIPPDLILPAVAQGAIAIECRREDKLTQSLMNRLNDPESYHETLAERAFLQTLAGGCQVPIAALARAQKDRLIIKGLVSSLDGSHVITDTIQGEIHNSEKMGIALAHKLIQAGAGNILKEII